MDSVLKYVRNAWHVGGRRGGVLAPLSQSNTQRQLYSSNQVVCNVSTLAAC